MLLLHLKSKSLIIFTYFRNSKSHFNFASAAQFVFLGPKDSLEMSHFCEQPGISCIALLARLRALNTSLCALTAELCVGRDRPTQKPGGKGKVR